MKELLTAHSLAVYILSKSLIVTLSIEELFSLILLVRLLRLRPAGAPVAG
jgi:hypothetical protein